VENAEPILAIDFGSTLTRAFLFDVVEGQYYFIASGAAPATEYAPYFNPITGSVQAVKELQRMTGRTFLDDRDALIVPVQSDGKGIGHLTITVSSGELIKVVTAGLLNDVSLASLERLVATSYCQVVDRIGVDDLRTFSEQLDSILFHKPELVLVAGGTEGGARRMILKNVHLINLACRLLPKGSRPIMMYLGNQALVPQVKEMLDKCSNVIVSSNINPSIDLEDLETAEIDLSDIAGLIRAHQKKGLNAITTIGSIQAQPTAQPFGRMIRFFSHLYDPQKRVLGVDVGSRSTVLAVAQNGKLWMNVTPYGNGHGLASVMNVSSLDDIINWLPLGLPEDMVRDYLFNKTLYPNTIPMTVETLAIEQALARRILQLCTREMKKMYPAYHHFLHPIIASGRVIGQAADPGQSLLMLLDGLQPVGVATLTLDQNGLLAALGATSRINTHMPVQVIETSAFENLGTVICPLSNERPGMPVLEARLEYEEGGQYQVEVSQGSIIRMPLQPKKTASLCLEPIRSLHIDPSRRRDIRKFKVTGGLCGVVIDTRGRPIDLPDDRIKRRELLSKWSEELRP